MTANTIVHSSSTEVLKKLTRIWMEYLELDSVCLEDDFISLGGSSILTLQMLANVAETFDTEIDYANFFDDPSLNSLYNDLLNSLIMNS